MGAIRDCGRCNGYMDVSGNIVRTCMAISLKPHVVGFNCISKRGVVYSAHSSFIPGRATRCRTFCNGNED